MLSSCMQTTVTSPRLDRIDCSLVCSDEASLLELHRCAHSSRRRHIAALNRFAYPFLDRDIPLTVLVLSETRGIRSFDRSIILLSQSSNGSFFLSSYHAYIRHSDHGIELTDRKSAQYGAREVLEQPKSDMSDDHEDATESTNVDRYNMERMGNDFGTSMPGCH
jgi:hypothetical protein